MEQPSAAQPTETNLPEKPAAVQFSMPQQNVNQPSGGQPQYQPLELPKIEPFRPSEPFSVGKLTLMGFNFVFAIITLALSLSLVVTAYSFSAFVGIIIAAVTAGASMIWQIAEFLTLLIRRSIYRPIHPGAHVGVHIVFDILSILVVASLCISLVYELSDWTLASHCDGTDGSYYTGDAYVYCGYETFSSTAQAGAYFRMLEALVAFSVLMAVSHLTLSVLACVETDRRRKYGKKTKVVYLVAGPGPVDGRLYYSQAPPDQVAAATRQSAAVAPLALLSAPPAASPEAYGYYAPAPAAAPTTAASARQ